MSLYRPRCSLRYRQEEEPGRWTLTGNYDVLVPAASATDTLSSHQGYHVLSFKQNHSDMVKFASRWDENYKLIKYYLEQFSVVARDVIQERFLRMQGKSSNSPKSPLEGWWSLETFGGNLY